MEDILPKDIIKEWGLSSLSKEKQKEMVDRLERVLYQAILVRALDILNEIEQTEFDLLLDEDQTTPSDVLSFLEKKIPTFKKLVEDEKKALKDEILVPV
jgi:hypothetical protein